ncbi:hypothetical protein C8035_v010236 [Colletotrichum spinosum]|uniref:Uncharacterized protein n=1 Tax=Colletotrichum spinosum TaxID=1347390 RepID=A0A4R8QD47_9PEZI|nr:hypothetical protein C8035_v010236 [Colletotrichum spinosum]
MTFSSEHLRLKPLPDTPVDEAPPPYEAKPSHSPAPGSSQPPPPRSDQPAQSQMARQFPATFNVYSQSFSRTLLLGEHRNAPFYAMSTHSGFSSSPPIVLHSGPANTFPPLASVEYHTFSHRMSITLPPAPKGSPGGGPVIELQSRTSFPSSTYSFTMGVGPNCERLEEFEWRTSSGEAIAILDGRHRGWKLVRLSHAAQRSAGRDVITGSDGREVVAAWTDAQMSISKAAKFGFLGSGQTGELGERWAIMAAMSGLAISERERQRRRNNSGSVG